jgi:hypothetical protein
MLTLKKIENFENCQIKLIHFYENLPITEIFSLGLGDPEIL